MSQIISRVQVEGNDVVSFIDASTTPITYVRSMSQILPQSPTYISYRYDTITISQVGGESFTFTTYAITEVGGNTFLPLGLRDEPALIQAKTMDIYRLLVTAIFKGCCECGNTEPECSIQYVAGNGSDLGTFLYDTGGNIRVNYFTANNQDFTGFWPIIQDGSWIFVFSKTDPTVYGVYQVSNYSDGGPGIYAQFDASLLAGPGEFPDGTDLCVDVTSVGGSLVQGWQDTLDINSVLDKDNTVDGAGFNFVFDNNESFTINSGGGFIETNATGASLNAGSQQILVTAGYIDIITPNHATAGTGWVLAKTSTGHVEYVEAGTGTISSIGLNMPPAFTVSTPNPLTENGEFTVDGAGDATQYINGLGELATLPVYTVENGLHPFGGIPGEAPPNPYLFHLGGQLIENTLIETTDGTTEYQLSVRGNVDQNTQFPFGVANLGIGGVATFQDYGSGDRPNPSVEIVGDVDLAQPLLELRMEGNLPNGTYPNSTGYLSLKYEGATANNVRSSIDFEYPDSGNNMFLAGRLTTELASNVNGNERSKFDIELIDGGVFETKLELNGTGQLTLNEYGIGTFINSAPTYALVVDSTGLVWKKALVGGGTVTEVTATGLLTTSPNPIETTGTVTSIMDSGFLVGRYSSGTGVFEQIVIGSGLTLTGDTLTADGGTGFDVQVNSTTIIPPATILNLKSGTGVDVVYEGSGNVRFDFSGTPSNQGLQDVIIVDNVLTQDNTVSGGITSFIWKSNSFYEINPVTSYDPGTGVPTPGYFKAWVGKYPPSYSELYVEAIYAQMKSQGATNQIVKVDTTGVYVQTPGLGSATVGQVLTLQNATTGQVEYQDAGGGPSPLTTKGDLYTFDTADTRLPVGTDGQILYADSAEATGLKWGDAPTAGGIPFGVAAGPDTYTATIAGVTAPYVDGDAYLIRFTDANTGASTLNINSIGAANLYSNSDGLLIGGDIWAGAQMLCVYNSSLPGFQCIGTAPNSLFAYVTNAETTAITKGMAVYAFGGTGDRLTVKKALATGDSTSAQTVGIVYSSSIAANQKGIIMIQGELVDIDLFPTSTGPENWVDGDPVYLSATTAGAVTKDKQYAPNHLVYLGVCVKASNGSSGRMYVRIQNGFELDELHNVQAQSPSLDDTLWYDNTVSPPQWKTASIPTILGYTPTPTTTSISTTAPLAGGGDLSADRTLSIADAAADGTTKGAATFTASDFDSAAGLISIDYTNGQSASASTKGFLTSADWTSFNTKSDSGFRSFTGASYTPADNTTLYFNQNINPTVNAVNHALRFPFNITITRALIIVANNQIIGSAESSTINFYNITTATASLISNAVNTQGGTNTTRYTAVSGLNINVSSTQEWCIQWVTPTWVTNPVNPLLSVWFFYKYQ